VPIKNPDFEESDDRSKPLGWDARDPGHVYQITDVHPYSGLRCLTIKSAYVVGRFLPIGWAADGQSVYAVNERRTPIVMIRTDGGELHPVMNLRHADDFSIQSVAITPEGNRVVYATRRLLSDVWIARNFDSGR